MEIFSSTESQRLFYIEPDILQSVVTKIEFNLFSFFSCIFYFCQGGKRLCRRSNTTGEGEIVSDGNRRRVWNDFFKLNRDSSCILLRFNCSSFFFFISGCCRIFLSTHIFSDSDFHPTNIFRISFELAAVPRVRPKELQTLETLERNWPACPIGTTVSSARHRFNNFLISPLFSFYSFFSTPDGQKPINATGFFNVFYCGTSISSPAFLLSSFLPIISLLYFV